MSDSAYEQSVVRCVDSLIKHAIDRGASDIHLEPTERNLRIRFRIDGVLYDQKPIELSLMHQIISRLKVVAQMNIAEKRLPQDGKFSIAHNKKPIDFRVSTFPSLFGEKIVIRILDRTAQAMAVEQLGFAPHMLHNIKQIIKKQNGFFLVTGPTGSGKTTTLYALLADLHSPEKNIVTLEDPVEYNLDGITQGHINSDAGFTFERGIRSLLRQDPDILMVGEIRDRETARTAIEAALTGHLVLSTLHTNDAPSAVMRLMDMKIEPFLINASLSGVLAQRLARTICNECREPVDPISAQEPILTKLGLQGSLLYKGRGCSWCGNVGLRGRTGIFELLLVSTGLRARIVSQPVFDDIYTQALEDNMCTLLQDGIEKVKSGIITLDELMRVIT